MIAQRSRLVAPSVATAALLTAVSLVMWLGTADSQTAVTPAEVGRGPFDVAATQGAILILDTRTGECWFSDLKTNKDKDEVWTSLPPPRSTFESLSLRELERQLAALRARGFGEDTYLVAELKNRIAKLRQGRGKDSQD
jgi:hypothetical protein